MASTTRKFRHGDRVTLDDSAPALLRREWVLLDLAHFRGAYGSKGRAWWLQDAETGEISMNYRAREAAMTLAEEA